MTGPAGKFPILISEQAIQSRVNVLAIEIAEYYGDERPLLIGVLNGAVMFLSDLARALPGDAEFEFMAVSSYGDATESSGAVKILKDLDSDISGKRILVVEDIVDSGTTLRYLLRMLQERDPLDIRVVTLLRKPGARASNLEPEWVGFDIEDEFVVGYGLDVAGRYRNLPYIATYISD